MTLFHMYIDDRYVLVEANYEREAFYLNIADE
jgi:hypothetical protein